MNLVLNKERGRCDGCNTIKLAQFSDGY